MTVPPTETPTVTPTPIPRFDLAEQYLVCDAAPGQLRVMVVDRAGEQMPNVELLVRWDGGDDRFITGLKPDVGPGYADFQMQKGVTYQLTVIGAESDVAQGILADTCEGSGALASWWVRYQWTREGVP